MATAATRRQRGNDAVNWLADYYREHGWPQAEPVGAGRRGSDILGMPGLAAEVKSGPEWRVGSWLLQAASPGRGGIPFVVVRGPGCGRGNLPGWPVIMRGRDHGLLMTETCVDHWPAWRHVTARQWNMAEWLRNAPSAPRLPFARYRGQGADPARPGSWPVIMRVNVHAALLLAAGYGSQPAAQLPGRARGEQFMGAHGAG